MIEQYIYILLTYVIWRYKISFLFQVALDTYCIVHFLDNKEMVQLYFILIIKLSLSVNELLTTKSNRFDNNNNNNNNNKALYTVTTYLYNSYVLLFCINMYISKHCLFDA